QIDVVEHVVAVSVDGVAGLQLAAPGLPGAARAAGPTAAGMRVSSRTATSAAAPASSVLVHRPHGTAAQKPHHRHRTESDSCTHVGICRTASVAFRFFCGGQRSGENAVL